MTMTMDKAQISRRGALAGLGGMSFCLALGADGAKLFSRGRSQYDRRQGVQRLGAHRAERHHHHPQPPAPKWARARMTNLPMIVAEEMDADWSKVAIEMAPADAGVYGYMMNNNQRMMAIVGSRATMLYYTDLRTAGAQVRKVLLMNAAEKWGVDASTLRTEPSVVINPANGQRLTYGEIAAFGKVPSPLPAVDAKELKAKKDWRLIGKGVPRRDTPLKVNGSAQYGIDVRLPGMVYATTLHSPVHNCAPESWNDAEIKKMPGVIGTVKLRNGVAVVADRFERALDGQQRAQGDLGRRARPPASTRSRRCTRTTSKHPSRSERAGADRPRRGRRQGGVRRRGQDLQGRVPERLRLSRADGAAQRGGPLQRRGRPASRSGKARKRPTPRATRWPRRSASRRSRSPTTSATSAAASAGATAASRRSRRR